MQARIPPSAGFQYLLFSVIILPMTKRVKVFVAMSGGVDSSVSAALLKSQGYDVVGIHMRCYNVDGCAEQDAEDARRAAETLNIPFYVFDFEQEYKDRVVKYMVDGYKKGITPNPDVMCNKEIKFGLFFDAAMRLGADYIATGHYVRRGYRIKNLGYRGRNKKSQNSKSYILYSAADKTKDQSYFLWTLTQDQLRHCLFPVGDLIKRTQVRKLAKKYGLPNAEKKDSQGICFLGQVTLTDFLKQYIPEKRGLVLSTTGEKLGEHRGAHFFTIGQRHGLGNLIRPRRFQGDTISPIMMRHNREQANNFKPFYVSSKDVKKNTVTVAEGDEDEALYRKEVELVNTNFIHPTSNFKLPTIVYARVRYRQPVQKARLVIGNSQLVIRKSRTTDQLPVTSYKLLFDVPIKFVAVGQSAVIYNKFGEMLGGGIIKNTR